jgi:DNA-binding FadR family transcriptional regulator
MKDMLKPLKTQSLVEVFVDRFEDLIITGRIAIGEKLPSERELALMLGVSRPVVHEGLLDLEAKGLVTMKPRVGTVVNDYRREGSIAILNSIINFQKGALNEELLSSMLAIRELVETETARLSALNRTEEQLADLEETVRAEALTDPADTLSITRLDFTFHHGIAMASGNIIYPLLINSFKKVYMNFTGLFFSEPALVPETIGYHRQIVNAVASKDPNGAASLMRSMLAEGERHLRRILADGERGQE